jgi:hypothetical protein
MYDSYTIIPNPPMRDLQKAAYRFNCIAQEEGFLIAFIGGFAAKMLGNDRPTQGLDVLIEPRFFDNWEDDDNSFGRTVVRRWAQRPSPDCPYLAEAPIPATTPNTPPIKWPIVVSRSSERKGIPIYPFVAEDETMYFRALTEGYIPGSGVLRPYSPMQIHTIITLFPFFRPSHSLSSVSVGYVVRYKTTRLQSGT